MRIVFFSSYGIICFDTTVDLSSNHCDYLAPTLTGSIFLSLQFEEALKQLTDLIVIMQDCKIMTIQNENYDISFSDVADLISD